MAVMHESKDAKREKLGKRIKVADAYVNLQLNADFQLWKTTQIDLKLERMRQGIVSIDRSDPAWKEKLPALVSAYQETKKAFEDCFVEMERVAKDAREKLKQLEKGV